MKNSVLAGFLNELELYLEAFHETDRSSSMIMIKFFSQADGAAAERPRQGAQVPIADRLHRVRGVPAVLRVRHHHAADELYGGKPDQQLPPVGGGADRGEHRDAGGAGHHPPAYREHRDQLSRVAGDLRVLSELLSSLSSLSFLLTFGSWTRLSSCCFNCVSALTGLM